MHDNKERAAFTISKSLKDELEEVIPVNKRSQFVEKAIADALLKEAKRKALESLKNLPAYDTGGRDSVEVLRQIRRERGDYIASRHHVAK
jgi:metal-responsive CopG/Arc/MetJ family transcriptional regulator